MGQSEWGVLWAKLLDASGADAADVGSQIKDLDYTLDDFVASVRDVTERLNDKLDVCPQAFDIMADGAARYPDALGTSDAANLARAALGDDSVTAKESVRILELLTLICQAGTDVAHEDIHAYAAKCCGPESAAAERCAAVNFMCKCLSQAPPDTNKNAELIAASLGKGLPSLCDVISNGPGAARSAAAWLVGALSFNPRVANDGFITDAVIRRLQAAPADVCGPELPGEVQERVQRAAAEMGWFEWAKKNDTMLLSLGVSVFTMYALASL